MFMKNNILLFLAILSGLGLLLSFTVLSEKVPERPEDISPLLVGESLPTDLSLTSLEGESVKLQEQWQAKPTVLIFYRGGWCPYCNRQLSGMQEIEPELKEMGYQIIAISPDSPEKLGKTVEKNELSYTLLSDNQLNTAQSLGIAFKLDEATVEKYKKYNIDLYRSAQGDPLMPVPTVMILDKSGKIKFEYINPNYKERLSAKLLLVAAEVALED